jgi:hypothetical protein
MQKNPLIIVIALLAVSFGAYVYFYPPVKNPKPIYNPEAPPVGNCVDCEKETEGQTFTHFSSVVKNYRERIWDDVNLKHFGYTTTGVPDVSSTPMFTGTDARTIWFDMDTIKRFFCTIEKYNKQLTNPGKSLGIRFFYAVYDSDDETESKRNRHTLFMVPTYKAADGSNVDFDPRETFYQQKNNTQFYSKEFKNKTLSYTNIYRIAAPMSLASPLALILGPDKSAIVNNGEICPTNCPNDNTLKLIDHP